MRDETRFAILIDAENISPNYVQIIFDEVSNYGVSTYRRIYGDWTSTRNNRWKEVLLDNSITPIQQYSYTEGKNSSDSAMIIDAMDILYTMSVDGFVLVSSDSDFTRLASRLRESGMAVIGMGESKTPNAFISACNTFKYLDILYDSQEKEKEKENRSKSDKNASAPVSPDAPPCPNVLSRQEWKKTTGQDKNPKNTLELVVPQELGSGCLPRREEAKNTRSEAEREEGRGNAPSKKNAPRPQTTIGAVRRALRSIVRENSDEENWISLANLGNQINKRFPDFDVRNYGHRKLVNFIESFHEFEVVSRASSEFGNQQLFVRLKDE